MEVRTSFINFRKFTGLQITDKNVVSKLRSTFKFSKNKSHYIDPKNIWFSYNEYLGRFYVGNSEITGYLNTSKIKGDLIINQLIFRQQKIHLVNW